MAKRDWEVVMIPVEKMAARVLSRHKLEPPFNLNELVSNYANIEYHIFPINADGVTINYPDKKPLILINQLIAPARQTFTLAHELGHIIIPWHIGTIVSKVSSHSEEIVDDWFTYREMETEANRFAAELLLPSSWIATHIESHKTFESYLNSIINITGTSLQPTLIKIEQNLKKSIILGEIHEEKIILRMRCHNAPRPDSIYVNIKDKENLFYSSYLREEFIVNGKTLICWHFNESNEFTLNDSRPWREILKQILNETKQQSISQNINAVLAANFQKSKDQSLDIILSNIIKAFDGRELYKDVFNHPLFFEYIKSRIIELSDKYKT